MSWASLLIERLGRGEVVQFRPVGRSMMPRIRSRDLVTVRPLVEGDVLVPGESVVLARVAGREYLHYVSATRPDGSVQISNAAGYVNGWTSRERVYGILIEVAR